MFKIITVLLVTVTWTTAKPAIGGIIYVESNGSNNTPASSNIKTLADDSTNNFDPSYHQTYNTIGKVQKVPIVYTTDLGKQIQAPRQQALVPDNDHLRLYSTAPQVFTEGPPERQDNGQSKQGNNENINIAPPSLEYIQQDARTNPQTQQSQVIYTTTYHQPQQLQQPHVLQGNVPSYQGVPQAIYASSPLIYQAVPQNIGFREQSTHLHPVQALYQSGVPLNQYTQLAQTQQIQHPYQGTLPQIVPQTYNQVPQQQIQHPYQGTLPQTLPQTYNQVPQQQLAHKQQEQLRQRLQQKEVLHSRQAVDRPNVRDAKNEQGGITYVKTPEERPESQRTTIIQRYQGPQVENKALPVAPRAPLQTVRQYSAASDVSSFSYSSPHVSYRSDGGVATFQKRSSQEAVAPRYQQVYLIQVPGHY